MHAVILAAGIGKRLRPFTAEHPKCLLTFGNKTLLRRHLEMIDGLSLQRIAVVVGHLANQVEDELKRVNCRTPVEVLHNERFAEGSALSLLCAETVLRNSPAIIMDADLLFCRAILERLSANPSPNCLLVDDRLVDTGEEVKVVVRSDGSVCELGKQIQNKGHVAGESIGIYKFSAETNDVLLRGLRQAVSKHPQIEYEAVIDQLLDQVQVRSVSVGDLPWVEIDFADDVERARREIWPAIMSHEPSPLLS